MLVLSRQTEQRITITGPCEICVLRIDGGKVRLGIEATASTGIVRTELLEQSEPIERREKQPA